MNPCLRGVAAWPCAPFLLPRAWPGVLLLVLLQLARPALAQDPRPDLSVADPESAATLPDWRSLRPSAVVNPELPATLDAAIRRWQAANRAVGEFPRGHVDLLRWEQAQGSPNAPVTPAALPALDWPEVWLQVQRQHADQVLAPQANAVETLQARQQWLALERQARQAWVQAVTAQAWLRLQHERLHAAQTAHALGERMATLGHWSRARFIPVQQAWAREQAALLQARSKARQTLEALASLMGVWPSDAVKALAQRLPHGLPVPAEVQAPPQAEGHALAQRPDLLWQRELASRQLRSVSQEQWSRWRQTLNDTLTRASARESAPPAAPRWPNSALRHDPALDQAVAAQTRLQREAMALRSRVRMAWDQLQATQALDALQREQLLPLAQAAETETLLRYNGMLQSTWELIDAARARLGAEAEALSAREAHWLAHIDWHTLMAGGDIEPPTGVSTNNSDASAGISLGH